MLKLQHSWRHCFLCINDCWLLNVLLHKSNGGKSEKLSPPMYTYTDTSTHMDNKVTTDDGADNDIEQI